MHSEDDVQYAINNTKVIVSPERRIATFGTTSFHFYLVTELMDSVNEIRVRDGKISEVREHADTLYSDRVCMGTPDKRAGVLERLAKLRAEAGTA